MTITVRSPTQSGRYRSGPTQLKVPSLVCGPQRGVFSTVWMCPLHQDLLICKRRRQPAISCWDMFMLERSGLVSCRSWESLLTFLFWMILLCPGGFLRERASGEKTGYASTLWLFWSFGVLETLETNECSCV